MTRCFDAAVLKGSEPFTVLVGTQGGAGISIATSERFITVSGNNGEAVDIREGETISMSGLTGEIFQGELERTMPAVPRLFRALTDCYFEARKTFGPELAWSRLTETQEYARQGDFIHDVVTSAAFRGFQQAKRHILGRTLMKTYVNVNNDACVVSEADRVRYQSRTRQARDQNR